MFTEDATCADLLAALLAVLSARPPYLREQDARRLQALLGTLWSHIVPPDWVDSEHPQAFVELPLSRLDHGLKSWVESWYTEEAHPLMSSHAIDAAEFVVAHAFGARGLAFPDEELVGCRLAPLVSASMAKRGWRSDCFLHDRRFKGLLTQFVRGRAVRVRVPPGGRCVVRSSGAIVLAPGDEFEAYIMQGQLTRDGCDYTGHDAIDETELPVALLNPFRLLCSLRPGVAGGPYFSDWTVRIPGGWMTHALVGRGYGESPVWVEVPAWLRG